MSSKHPDGRHGPGRARELFFEYDGSTFYMSRDGADQEYARFHVPASLEAEWLAELTEGHLAALDKPGNYWVVNFLVHHKAAGHLEKLVAQEPLGELWQRLAYLELLLKYLHVDRSAGASLAVIADALERIRPKASELVAACRSEATQDRAQKLVDEIERRQTKLALRISRRANRSRRLPP